MSYDISNLFYWRFNIGSWFLKEVELCALHRTYICILFAVYSCSSMFPKNPLKAPQSSGMYVYRNRMWFLTMYLHCGSCSICWSSREVSIIVVVNGSHYNDCLSSGSVEETGQNALTLKDAMWTAMWNCPVAGKCRQLLRLRASIDINLFLPPKGLFPLYYIILCRIWGLLLGRGKEKTKAEASR